MEVYRIYITQFEHNPIHHYRRKNELVEDLPSEILDCLCLNYAINYEINSLAVGVMNFLLFSSDFYPKKITQVLYNLRHREHAFRILKGFSEHWQQVYLVKSSQIGHILKYFKTETGFENS